jgi:DeoR/GlpR family transcriptional regulator of sugar metabolism
VVTHSPSVAVELAGHRFIDVELIGGRLFKHSVVTVGAGAMEAIARVRADACCMGVTGIHPQMGLTTGDAGEATIKRALSRQSAETFVLASREKLGSVSAFLVLPLEEVESLVVEPGTSGDVVELYRAAGLTVITH